jgi:WD40 repeat protein
MLLRRFATLLLLAVISGLPFAVSAQSSCQEAVRSICLSSNGHEPGLAVAFSPDGNQIAVGLSSGISLYNSQSLLRERFIETGTWSRSVAYSPDGVSLAAALFDGTAKLWRASDPAMMQTFVGHSGWVRSIVFSRDGGLLVTAGDDDTVRVWNAATASPVWSNDRLSGVRVVALSPDDRTLAVGLQDSSIQLLNLSDSSLIRVLKGHEDWVRSLAFSPDGRTLASGAFDATARLWDVETGRLDYTLSGHKSSVLGLAFSPDGKTLATASVDTTVKLWNASDGSLIQTLIGHTDFVYGVAFSPDGKVLASSSADNTVRLWDLSIPAIESVARPATSSDCRDCHHPRGVAGPPRVIQVSCEACHGGGIGMNWCAGFPRAAQAISKASYVPPVDPVGVPISYENLAVQIQYPANGETLYTSGNNMAPVFVQGRVFYQGDRSETSVHMQIFSDGQLTDELVTQPGLDGSFVFRIAINPQASPIVAGAKAADPDCAPCHEDFKSQASFPNGKVHFVITAVSPGGEQALDERWFTVDTSGKVQVAVQVVDDQTGGTVPDLSVRAAAILYEWRDRYAVQSSNEAGIASLPVEALSQAVTQYEITVPPASLNGYLYESVDPVIVNLPPGATTHDPLTIRVHARAGQITGTLTGAQASAPVNVWAVSVPDGRSYKTAVTAGSFILTPLPVGGYRVLVDPALEQLGYRAEPVLVDLTHDPLADINMSLNEVPANMLSGQVTDTAGASLPFGWITSASTWAVPLDPFAGAFHMSGLDPSKATVIANVPGYYSQAQGIDLSNQQTASLDFSLVLRPDTKLLPWGDGRIVLPADTRYKLSGVSIALDSGWIWGANNNDDDLAFQVAGQQIVLKQGRFALQYLQPEGGWFYLMDGNATIFTADHQPIEVSAGQMVALSDQYAPVPVAYNEAALVALQGRTESPLQNNWQPTLEAQLRDRLARIGISIAQIVTFVTYILVLIVIAGLLIGAIYSTWKYIRRP